MAALWAFRIHLQRVQFQVIYKFTGLHLIKLLMCGEVGETSKRTRRAIADYSESVGYVNVLA